jgi:excinuclease ABC subunit C
MLPVSGPLADALRDLPDRPGVYRFYNEAGDLLYVGKARSLRTRVRSYYSSRSTDHRMVAHVPEIARVEWEVTRNEARALVREGELIAEHHPRYNVDAREGREGVYLHLSDEPYPRIDLVRGRPDSGEPYGPYAGAGAARRVLRTVTRISRVRSCGLDIPPGTRVLERPCLLGELGRCAAPCLGEVDEQAYATEVGDLRRFLAGDRDALVAELEARMRAAAEIEQFERAAVLRDRITAIRDAARATPARRDADPAARLASRKAALARLCVVSGISSATRVVCFDVATLHGTHTTGAMGVAIDGAISRRDERTFHLRPQAAEADDVAAHRELAVRYLRAVGEGREPRPDLVLVDGAITQLGAWHSAAEETGVLLPCIGIAKEPDRLITTDGRDLGLEASDPGLLLAGEIRDRAHRRAGALHRVGRRDAMLASALDGVAGLGTVIKTRLLRRFGSVDAIARAADADLLDVEGVGAALLRAIRDRLG